MLCIPPNPTTEGQLEVDLDLSTEEWHGITSRLKEVLAHLKAQNEYLNSQGLDNDTALEQQDSHLDDQAVHAESPVQAADFQHLLSPEPGPVEQQHALPASGLPAALQAMLESSAPQASQQASQEHAEVGQTRHYGQEEAVKTEQAAHAPSQWPEQISQQLWDSAPAPQQAHPPPEVGTWTVVWRTDDLDSDGALISGLAYVPGLPGLPGGDGHAGFLISAANQALNLYECSASGGRGEASLQLMHQLSAETQISMLAADVNSLLLLASSQDVGRPTRCVSMHSLNPERGLFEPQGRVPLPPIGCPLPNTATLLQHKPQVASLHGLGGPLTGCCAASFGTSLVVYSTKCAPGEIPKPKAYWQGHTAPVTSIHASEYGMQLWSGAQDGGMHAWDMRNKPSQPAVKLHQTGGVRGICYVREHCLQSGSSDGRVHVWDVRYPQQALHSLHMPDSGGVTASALSPFRDALVVGTVKGGVFAISMADEQYSITQCARLEAPVSHICWNGGTGEVYASVAAQVAVLRQR